MADAESRWLLRAFGRLFIAAFVVIALLGLVLGWPAATVGNLFQLIGLLIAGLAIPILSPALANVEVRASAAKVAVVAWLSARRSTLRRWWARILRRPPKTVTASFDVHARATASISATVTTGYGVGDARELAIRALDEIKQLREYVEAGRAAERAETRRDIDALRTELQEHVLSITREGWHYVAGGASVTAFGIVVALFG